MLRAFNFDHSLEFSSNTYILSNNQFECVIIDLGSTSEKILNYLSENNLNLKAILLTHGHFDHIRGIDKIKKIYPKTPIYIHFNDFDLLKDPKLNCSLLNNENISLNFDVNFTKDKLNFGEKLEFEVIETPYHTMGSVCYYYKEENLLFTGDSLFRRSIGRYDLVTSNPQLVQSSLNKFKTMDPNIKIYPGHGEMTTLKEEFKNNIYLR